MQMSMHNVTGMTVERNDYLTDESEGNAMYTTTLTILDEHGESVQTITLFHKGKPVHNS